MIERYLQIRAATVAGHLPSGELGYLADVTGLLQLWRVAPDGLHEQVTFASERVTAALASPTEERWVIARDVGGNERHALFSIDANGGSELPLSDDAEAIHVPGAFSPDGRHLAFTHTGRNGVDFDVAVVAVSGGGRRELAQPGGWSHVVDWAESGILVQRANTPFDHDLLLVDPDGGEATLLTPHDDEVAFDSARLLSDGAVLCASDGGGEFARLAVLRRGAGPELLTADDADVEIVALDEAREHRAWTVNRGGESEVWLDGVAPRWAARRRRLGTVLRARRLADDHGGAARRLDRRVDGRAGGAPAHALGRGRPRPLGVRAARARAGGELRRPSHPLPAFRRGGAPGALLGARRAGIAVPPADGAGHPVPVRPGHHRRGAQRARLDGLWPHVSPSRRRRAATRLGLRPRGAGPGARRRSTARPSA